LRGDNLSMSLRKEIYEKIQGGKKAPMW
jgi:sRNA-binding carbon storage regulator CsrA